MRAYLAPALIAILCVAIIAVLWLVPEGRSGALLSVLDGIRNQFGTLATIIGVAIGGIAGLFMAWPRGVQQRNEPEPIEDDTPAPVRKRGLISASELSKASRPDYDANDGESEEARAELAEAQNDNTQAALTNAKATPIVFRELYPPHNDTALSYYGGMPIAGPDFIWPRADGRALPFLMQWDCAALAQEDTSGLIPESGILYLFGDLEWNGAMEFRFIHAAANFDELSELIPPHDATSPYGEEARYLLPECSPHVPAKAGKSPQTLPKWPFAPVALPLGDILPESDQENALDWPGDAAASALLDAQNRLGGPLTVFDPERRIGKARPFASFPQDWAAVRIVCAAVLDKLQSPENLGKAFLDSHADVDRPAVIAEWGQQAAELYAFAAAQPIAETPDDAMRDDIWAWIESVMPAISVEFGSLVDESVNTSLGIDSDGRDLIDNAFIEYNALQHTLAHSYQREPYPDEDGVNGPIEQIHAPAPARIFGPPSFVQGDAQDIASEEVMLLELSSNPAIGHHLGEGVLQFFIAPNALAARAFDRVKTVVSAY